MFSKPASRRTATALRTSSGPASRSSTRRSSRLEGLRAERDAVDAAAAKERRELGRDGLRVGLDRHLHGLRQRAEQALERGRLGEGGRAAPEEDRLGCESEQLALELQLCEQRLDVGRVLAEPADRGHEVAVAAAVGAERQVHVEVACAARHWCSRRRGLGTSSPPQFGQMWENSSPHIVQNVHSKEQMTAAPAGSSARPHRSHELRISRLISSPLRG